MGSSESEAMEQPVVPVEEPVVTAVPVDRTVLERVVGGTYHDPHQVLGPHLGEHGGTGRVLRPFASAVTVLYDGKQLPLRHEFDGIWVGVLHTDKLPDYRLEASYTDGPSVEVDDPYR